MERLRRSAEGGAEGPGAASRLGHTQNEATDLPANDEPLPQTRQDRGAVHFSAANSTALTKGPCFGSTASVSAQASRASSPSGGGGRCRIRRCTVRSPTLITGRMLRSPSSWRAWPSWRFTWSPSPGPEATGSGVPRGPGCPVVRGCPTAGGCPVAPGPPGGEPPVPAARTTGCPSARAAGSGGRGRSADVARR